MDTNEVSRLWLVPSALRWRLMMTNCSCVAINTSWLRLILNRHTFRNAGNFELRDVFFPELQRKSFE